MQLIQPSIMLHATICRLMALVWPQVASVGKSERELKDEHTEYVVYKRELSEVDRCVLDGETQGACS